MNWAKHWVGMTTDDKHEAAAKMAKCCPLLPPVVWGALFERAIENGDGSFSGFRPEVLAAKFRVAVAEIRRVMQAFAELGMIAGERLINWGKRQGEAVAAAARAVGDGAVEMARSISRSTSTERVRRFRAKLAAAKGQADLFTGQAETHETPVSPPTYREEEEEIREEVLPSGESAREEPIKVVNLTQEKARRGGCRTRIAADWEPDEADRRYAEARGYGFDWIADQTELFRDHHSARGSAFADWHAAWRTWVQRAAGFGWFNSRDRGETAAERRNREGRRSTLAAILAAEAREQAQDWDSHRAIG